MDILIKIIFLQYFLSHFLEFLSDKCIFWFFFFSALKSETYLLVIFTTYYNNIRINE